MKKTYLALASICASILSLNAHALNPINGWYMGGLAGIVYAPSIDGNINTSKNPLPGFVGGSVPVTIKYNVSGNAALTAGIRNGKFRGEAELLYTTTNYDSFTVGGVAFPRAFTTGPCTASGCSPVSKTSVIGGLFNAYYDFLPQTGNTTAYAPYIGVGVGVGYATNDIKFVNVDSQATILNYKADTTALAYQVILGVNYY